MQYTSNQEIAGRVVKLIVRCTNCSAGLPDENLNSQSFDPCPICSSSIRADVFPAAYNSLSEGTSGELLMVDNESGCFYHPGKQAVTSCSHCGRFLCSLCDIDFDDRHLCISCIESGKKKGKIKNLENSRARYDNIALGFSVFPLFFWFITLITSFITIYIVIRYWKKTAGIVSKHRARMVLALLFALMQITGWSVFFIGLITR